MGHMLELSPHPDWVATMRMFVQPQWDGLLEGEFVTGGATGELTVDELRGWMLHMYPFIHTFPKFLAEALIKAEDDATRSFLIDNIRVEKAHAEHWIWMAEGFGLKRQDLLDLAAGNRTMLRDVQSLTDWLWYINAKGSLAEAVAATSYAIEGATGELTRKTLEGFMSYGRFPGVVIDARSTRWMRSHARYDDDHPQLALEVIKRYASTPQLQHRAMLAARRSLQLLDLAMTTSFRAHSQAASTHSMDGTEKRRSGRRQQDLPLAFPERRFGERRGRLLTSLA
ncbi:MAG: TenA family transcriptional regulator [Burkholderiales bacterium]